LGSSDKQRRVRNCEQAGADLVRMTRTNSELSNDIELNDAALALVQGGAQLPVRVIDPTPKMDEKALKKLHEQLNGRGLRGV
jgi:hypothetical protein